MIRKDGTVSVKQIFKVMAWVIQKDRKGLWNDVYRESHIVIAHPKRAREIYDDCLNRVECSLLYGSNKKGSCLLFVPHIHENGELAYWPDNEQYIEKFIKE
jgi:hypothetical protein